MKWFVEILKKRSWKVYAFMFGVFFFFFFLSILSSKYMLEVEPEKVKELLQQIKESPVVKEFKNLLYEKKYLEIISLIFLHNLRIALLNYFFGIGFLFAVLIQASNGFVIGFLISITPQIFSDFVQLSGILIVLFLELIVMTATAVEGMYLTYTYIRPEKMWKTKDKIKAVKKTLMQSIKLILLCILILLLAAIIETLVIYYQVSQSLEPTMLGV